MNFTNLGGNSGCKIFLAEDSNNHSIFVRKISADVSYNSRLELQARKQMDFKSDSASAPEIYAMGYTPQGLFYFDMEYIRGITLAEYMKTIHVSSIHGIAEAVMDCIIPSGNKGSNADIQAFTEKITSLQDRLSGMNNTVIDRAVNLLSCHDWNNFYATPCHGDLTLENIIVKNGRLYLIDFLDSFYDCWMIDAATLFQDSWLMWSYRNEAQDINTVIRLIVFRDIMEDMITEKAGSNITREIYFALLLKLIRIYPYAKDKITLNFLDSKTRAVLRILDYEDADNTLCRE